MVDSPSSWASSSAKSQNFDSGWTSPLAFRTASSCFPVIFQFPVSFFPSAGLSRCPLPPDGSAQWSCPGTGWWWSLSSSVLSPWPLSCWCSADSAFSGCCQALNLVSTFSFSRLDLLSSSGFSGWGVGGKSFLLVLVLTPALWDLGFLGLVCGYRPSTSCSIQGTRELWLSNRRSTTIPCACLSRWFRLERRRVCLDFRLWDCPWSFFNGSNSSPSELFKCSLKKEGQKNLGG